MWFRSQNEMRRVVTTEIGDARSDLQIIPKAQ
jgi:hypothetical protein